jgi:hypothetical protein
VSLAGWISCLGWLLAGHTLRPRNAGVLRGMRVPLRTLVLEFQGERKIAARGIDVQAAGNSAGGFRRTDQDGLAHIAGPTPARGGFILPPFQVNPFEDFIFIPTSDRVSN